MPLFERYKRRSGNAEPDTTIRGDTTISSVSESNRKIVDICTSQGAYLDMYDYVCDVVEDKEVLYATR